MTSLDPGADSGSGPGTGYIRLAFTEDRPDGPFVPTNQGSDTVRRALGHCCFGPNWASSHNFRGENINLARHSWEYVAAYPDLNWWQVHVRGWVRSDGGCYLRGHFETMPEPHPQAHLAGDGYDVEAGMCVLEECLQSQDIPIGERLETVDDL